MLKLVRRSGGLLHQLRSRVSVSGFCSSSTGARKPLGDQKTVFYLQHKKQQRIGYQDRFERKQFHGYGYARPGAHLANFGGGGFDPKALRVKGSFGRGGEHRSKPIDWENEELTPSKKYFYEDSTTVSARSDEEVEDWMKKREVTLDGSNIPRPVFSFEEAGFPAAILQRLTKNYETPTVIQSISWPIAMSGRDIISVAKTGSGKTLAFTLAGIVHTSNQAQRKHGDGPTVLVLLPTRELAQQVQEVATPYCRDNGLSLTCVFGGSGRNPQMNALPQGVDVLIATPGRLLDFLDSGYTDLRRCSYVVLDEADRMLDMGFEPQMRRILGQVRPDRQTLMFSATWPILMEPPQSLELEILLYIRAALNRAFRPTALTVRWNQTISPFVVVIRISSPLLVPAPRNCTCARARARALARVRARVEYVANDAVRDNFPHIGAIGYQTTVY
uniref:RNA helicase n=1 Tax=Steinernema glaseri TaxID=37863 RepID=A0A1I7YPQ1_9BILA